MNRKKPIHKKSEGGGNGFYTAHVLMVTMKSSMKCINITPSTVLGLQVCGIFNF